MATKDDLLTEALKLPATERAEVAETLLDSLDDESADTSAVSKQWAEVAARRADEMESGAVEGIDAFEFLRTEREALRKRLGRK